MAQPIAKAHVESASATASDIFASVLPSPLAARNAAAPTSVPPSTLSTLGTLTTLATLASQTASSPPSSASTVANEDPGDASGTGPLTPAQIAGIVVGISVFMLAGFAVVFAQMVRRARRGPEEEQRAASRQRAPEVRVGTTNRSVLSG